MERRQREVPGAHFLEDIGKVEAARAIEPPLWCIPDSYAANGVMRSSC